MNEKQEKFHEIGEKRINNILDSIRIFGNLASNSYEFTREEIDAIFSMLQGNLDKTKEKFYTTLDKKIKKEKTSFSFSSIQKENKSVNVFDEE